MSPLTKLAPGRPARPARPARHVMVLAFFTAIIVSLTLASPGGAEPFSPARPGNTQSVAPAGDLDFSVQRVSGGDRYATAAALSKRFFSPGVPVAVIANGTTFPDGLTAGPVADQLGGPVLFVKPTQLPSATRTELTRLRPRQIIVLGGTASISEGVRDQLDALTTGSATRVSGADRYDTSAAASARTFPSGSSLAYVATGASFPDALAGGAAAGVQEAPVLLTRGTSLPPAVRDELMRLDPDRIMVLGGTASVSNNVLRQLRSIATAERVSGADRYQTALAISQRVFGPSRPGVILATGENFPDALAAAGATPYTRGPILLTRRTSLAPGTLTELSRLGPTTAYPLGGTSSVGVPVAKAVQRRLGVCWSGPSYGPGSQQVITQVSGTDSKKMAFTLDMGGRMGDAQDIVQWLTDHQVCTTFFATSLAADTTEGRAVMRKIAAHPELFEVGNHTVHHCDLVNGGGGSPTSAPCARAMTASFIRSELTSAEPVLRLRSGGMQLTPYWRPPYGSNNGFVRDQAAAVGYTKTIMWNRDTIDWDPNTTKTQIINRVTSPLPPSGSISLSHMGGYHTYEALPSVVSILRSHGYTLTTVSDMRDG